VSVATTYAEALYEAAVEGRALAPVAEAVAAFAEAVGASEELRTALADPKLDTRQKTSAVAALAEGAHPLFVNFLQVLVDRGRIGEVAEIARAFEERVARAEGRLEVEAVTAVPLPDDLRRRIVERIREETGATVALTQAVDPEIVGGLVLRVGGVVIDGSVRHRIEELRESLRAASVDAAAVA
jgi:F-type H+-transporting ATPase subunit delta